MDRTLQRFERLLGQGIALERARPMERPFAVLRYPDEAIARQAYGIYSQRSL